VLAVLFVLMLLLGLAAWSVRSGYLPESWIQRLRPWLRFSWWFEVGEETSWPASAGPERAEGAEAGVEAEAAVAGVAAERIAADAVPRSETLPEPLPAPVAASPAPRVARRKLQATPGELPVIGLDDVASNLRGGGARPPARRSPASDAPIASESGLPLLDTTDLRANLMRSGRLAARLRAASETRDASLPLIDEDEVSRNLQAAARSAPPEAPAELPLIDPSEVRASLQAIHGERLKERAPTRHAVARRVPPLSIPPRAPETGRGIAVPPPSVPPVAPVLAQPASSPLFPSASVPPASGSVPTPVTAPMPSAPASMSVPSAPTASTLAAPASVSAPSTSAAPTLAAPASVSVPSTPAAPTPAAPASVSVPSTSAAPTLAAPVSVSVPSTPAAPTPAAPVSASVASPLAVPPSVSPNGSAPAGTPRVAPALADLTPSVLFAATAAPLPRAGDHASAGRAVIAANDPTDSVPGDSAALAGHPVDGAPLAGAQVEEGVVDAVVLPVADAAPDGGLVWQWIEEKTPEAPPVVAGSNAIRAWTPAAGFERSDCLPGLDLLQAASEQVIEAGLEEALLERGIVIEEKLAEFKVKVSVVDAYAGPVITRFEVEPAIGVRGSQVVNLVKDLSRALGLASIRVVETIPGKTCMGLELPNPVRQMIRLSEILSSEAFMHASSPLTLVLGKDITGQPVVTDLGRAPHLLVAGTTGSGKSVGVNAMILSILYKATPDEVRFIMIDPKMLELSVYNDIPHLLAPVVTDMKLAANALNWCVGEMEKRYRLMSALGVRNLAGYNEKIHAARELGEHIPNPFSLTPETPEPLEALPFIVVVVDEFADLMMVAGKKIEELIARLAQKARAAGVHLILATQRPSVDVITGLIKANIPTRIAFQVSSKVDSRTILDQMGAEALLGQGDMLFLPPGSGYPQRIHGAFVADDEVHGIVEFLKQFGEPDYVEGVLSGEAEAEEAGAGARAAASESDPLYDEAVEIVLKTRKASISSVQRHLRIGYNRAARLIEEMEAAGLVSSMESNGNRNVLVPQRDY
jgi:S-DNA-T family DNA segregation ATPase FtsK/SpoIIIE